MTGQVAWTRLAVLKLYKNLLKEGARLHYTDKDYYRRSIQKEFRAHIGETSVIEKQRQLNKGFYFLHNKLGGLV